MFPPCLYVELPIIKTIYWYKTILIFKKVIIDMDSGILLLNIIKQ